MMIDWIIYAPCYVSSKREDNIKMDLREIGWGGMDGFDLASDINQ
jgi:hypothetical protein